MMIDYNHSQNQHASEGPLAALPTILGEKEVNSLLDVGCGTGHWLKAALHLGVKDVMGIDGVAIPETDLVVPSKYFHRYDFTQPIDLGRKFDLVVCLEVGEHLEEGQAGTLIDTLVTHGNRIAFSAACPSQPGQHHVNCQWPSYWQRLFNARGYTCSDSLRWALWENPEVEWWYRQNLMEATLDPKNAGLEPRLPAVIHPDHFNHSRKSAFLEGRQEATQGIAEGGLPAMDYITMISGALSTKIRRRLSR